MRIVKKISLFLIIKTLHTDVHWILSWFAGPLGLIFFHIRIGFRYNYFFVRCLIKDHACLQLSKELQLERRWPRRRCNNKELSRCRRRSHCPRRRKSARDPVWCPPVWSSCWRFFWLPLRHAIPIFGSTSPPARH